MVHTPDVPLKDNVSFRLLHDLNAVLFPNVEHDHACYIVNGRPISVGHRIPRMTDVMTIDHFFSSSQFVNCQCLVMSLFL